MKLRLRSIESKETLKIEVPTSCALLQLKQILSQTLANSPPPASIRLSLNRIDELQPTSPNGEGSIQSLGITAGDLIFFTVESNSVPQIQDPLTTPTLLSQSPQTVHNPQPEPVGSSYSQNPPLADSKFVPEDTESSQNTRVEAENSEGMNWGAGKRKSPDLSAQMGDAMTYMEVDDGGDINDGFVVEAVEKSFSVPGFLRKVFTEELGDDSGRDHKLIVIAIHAVLLESGFVRFDLNLNEKINGFQFQAEWPSASFRLSLFYTLPEIVSHAEGNPIDCVVLKFQSLGKFINVYGSLANGAGRSGTHWVRLNEEQLVPFLNVVWANCCLTENINGSDGRFLGTSPEKEVFTFWRSVKDNLALPLLIDLCEKTGFELPPCFMRLPTDLKLKILELLPGVDVAKVSCVCSELQYLASSDDLWKLKFTEQFGVEGLQYLASNNDLWKLKYAEQIGAEGVEARGGWKKAFVRTWKNRKLGASRRLERTRLPNPYMVPWGPRIRGGYRDIGPLFDDHVPMILGRRTFSPHCNLGGPNRSNFV
ncbi:F-box protein SKIP22 [Forsythia ovata]|uniref:F-box protein SKIP22 n=1 Tax=Forsythia ovata TaxID=205694 RepID=A0ABD1QN83_9LAMI